MEKAGQEGAIRLTVVLFYFLAANLFFFSGRIKNFSTEKPSTSLQYPPENVFEMLSTGQKSGPVTSYREC